MTMDGARLRTPITGNHLFYGDNLEILRDYMPNESVDLVYLDPPFNSNANYNVLFRAPTGAQSEAQIEAFEDSWHWNQNAEDAFDQVMMNGNTDAAEMLRAMRGFLKENDMMAYLTMMAVRLLELHRILKPAGSIYLHCDPTASHYLKLLLDSIFGPTNFINELAWKRYGAHNDVVQGSKHYGRVQDTILFYAKNSGKQTWTQLYTELSQDYSDTAYRYKDVDGRRYRLSPLTGPGGAEKGNPVYEWNGHTRAWRIGQAKMQAMHDAGQLVYSKTGYVSKKLYLDQSKGTPVQTMWTDIASLSGSMTECMGYPRKNR